MRLLRHCLHELEAGRPVVRAVILKTWGSTPRETGADMVIDSSGNILGTVGGGCGEAEVYELAQQMLMEADSENGSLLHVDLTENPEDGGGKVCGGRFDVLLHRLSSSALPELRKVLKALEEGDSLNWVTSLGGVSPGFWKRGELQKRFGADFELLPSGGLTDSRLASDEGRFRFWEPLGRVRRLIIVGAGHIARPLCAMAALADYRVSVLDDRAEYAREEFFPAAESVLCGEYGDVLPDLARGDLVSVVLVTRGHRHDQECLRLVVEYPIEYLGMIGSQRRIEAVFQDLVDEGVPVSALQRVRAPIGLDIGARTPAEIACCILAEMIQKRRCSQDSGRKAPPRERHLRSLKCSFDIN